MASSPLDVIKSYLISLGFSVDKSSYDSATKAIDSAGETLAKFAGSTVKNFAIAGGSIAAFVAIAVEKMAKFIGNLGDAQIRYEMLARQMWTTQQNAEAFDTTLKAMGTTLQDLYLSPTLMQQFQELHSQAFQMMPPAEFQQQMSFIQSITFEFKRLKLEGTYALQWIGYYFIKYMSGPIGNIKTTLSEVNDIIIKTMPYWTKVVAEVMSWFGQFGVTVVEANKDILLAFEKIGDSVPKNIKMIGLALLGLAIIMNQGPLGWTIDAIVALGLAINDFFTYIHGGQSEFGPFWQKLIDLYNYLKDTGSIDAFKNGFKTALKDISKWIDDTITDIKDFWEALKDNGAIKDFQKSGKDISGIFKTLSKDISGDLNNLQKTLDKSGIWDTLNQDMADWTQSIGNVTQAFTGLIDVILGLKGTQDMLKGFGDSLNNLVLDSLKEVDRWINRVTDGLNALADVLQGKWGDAWKNAKGIITGQSSTSPQSYMYPSTSNHQTSNSSQTNMNVTQNIYGSSDPNVTANAASSNITTMMRNTKGVIM